MGGRGHGVDDHGVDFVFLQYRENILRRSKDIRGIRHGLQRPGGAGRSEANRCFMPSAVRIRCSTDIAESRSISARNEAEAQVLRRIFEPDFCGA